MTRQQLTLFIPDLDSDPVETLRAVLDPVQDALIRAHVTLCREDELPPFTDVDACLRRSGIGRLELSFGPPERSERHGILLPCVGGEHAFQQLRRSISGSDSSPSPHITLAHPRNPRARGNPEGPVHHLLPPMSFVFTAVSLVEQFGSRPWRILATFPLSAEGAADSAGA